jgi:hypothetical protein
VCNPVFVHHLCTYLNYQIPICYRGFFLFHCLILVYSFCQITPFTKDGVNKISLTGCDARIFCLGVRLVKRRTVQQVALYFCLKNEDVWTYKIFHSL